MYQQDFTPMPLTNDQTKLLTLLMLESDSAIDAMEKDIAEEHVYRVLSKRVEVLNVNVCKKVKMMLFFVVSSLGEIALFVNDLRHMGNGNKIDLTDFLMNYPNGFPSPSDMERFWTEQKTDKGINRVDTL